MHVLQTHYNIFKSLNQIFTASFGCHVSVNSCWVSWCTIQSSEIILFLLNSFVLFVCELTYGNWIASDIMFNKFLRFSEQKYVIFWLSRCKNENIKIIFFIFYALPELLLFKFNVDRRTTQT